MESRRTIETNSFEKDLKILHKEKGILVGQIEKVKQKNEVFKKQINQMHVKE